MQGVSSRLGRLRLLPTRPSRPTHVQDALGAPDATAAVGLVVPLYNEETRFAEYGKLLIDFIAQQPPGSELVFVDDGSSDGTASGVEELIASHPERPVRLLRRPHRGKGAAVADGLRTVQAAYAGFCDLDLSTPLDQFERVLRSATQARMLAVGSRDLAGSTVVRNEGVVREALGRIYNRLLQATLTPGVVDTQCGAKVAAREVWCDVLPHCREAGYAWDAEVIAVARALGVAVQEVPIEWHHDDRSRVRVTRDGAAMVWATARIWRNVRRLEMKLRRPAAGGVFDAANADLLMSADGGHWWFRSKAAFVATALRRTRRPTGATWLVDAGAGAGGVSSTLGWDPERVMVVEGNGELVTQARRRHGLHAVQGSVDRLPLADGFADVVCLLDVVEHLAEPVVALREAERVLGRGGRLIVTVPAHEWLWSPADEFLGHVRRYRRDTLRMELGAAGFRPIVITHVFSWLVLPVWLKRRLRRGGRVELGLDQTSGAVDVLAMVLTRIERGLVGRRSLPLGTSVLCVADKLSDG